MVDWKYPGAFLGGLFAMAAVTAVELYYIGVGTRARQKYNAVVVRLLYITYFVLLGYLISWMPQGFHGSGGSSVSFNLHPLFMSIAWAFCATEAAMSFRSPFAFARKTKKQYHAVMNFLAFGFSISGIAIVFVNHQQKKHAHMATQHSWVGFVAAVCMAIQYLLGLSAFYMSKNKAWKQRVMPFHKFFGAATYLSALSAISMGLFNNYGIPAKAPGPYSHYHRVNETATLILWSIAIRVLAGFGGAGDAANKNGAHVNGDGERKWLLFS